MNAVNLIPSDRRRGGAARPQLSASPPTLGVIAGLVVVLAAAILYVSAANRVDARRQELAHLSAGVAGWTAAASSYSSYLQAAQQRTKQVADVVALAATRYPWSDLLSQLAGLMPRDAALSTLQATTPVSAVSSTTSSTSSSNASGIQLSGCAASQSAVAQTMTQLHRLQNVSSVTLTSSSSAADSSATSSSSSGSSSGASCPFPVQFQISLGFGSVTGAVGAASTGSSAATSAPAPAGTSTGVTQ